MNIAESIDFKYLPFFLERKSNVDESSEEYTLYACYGDVGVFPNVPVGNGTASLLYTGMFYKNTLDIFKNALVDLDHKGESAVVGKVLETWMNDDGFTTENNNTVKPNRLPWCKMAVKLTKEQRESIKGVSTKFDAVNKPVNEVINTTFCTHEVIGVNTAKQVYISLLLSIEPRMHASTTVVNGIIENEQELLDNNKNVSTKETSEDMTEEEIKKIVQDTVLATMTEMKKVSDAEKVSNSEDSMEKKDNVISNSDEEIKKDETVMNSEGLDEMKSMLSEILTLLKSNNTSNSDEEVKEDKTTMNSDEEEKEEENNMVQNSKGIARESMIESLHRLANGIDIK